MEDQALRLLRLRVREQGSSAWLPPGVNFTKILRANFLYKSVLQSFSVWHCNFMVKEYVH